ncbi:MAG: hypothetical protein ACP5U1_16180, partial [Desulfomonilaceae bacterium]
ELICVKNGNKLFKGAPLGKEALLSSLFKPSLPETLTCNFVILIVEFGDPIEYHVSRFLKGYS